MTDDEKCDECGGKMRQDAVRGGHDPTCDYIVAGRRIGEYCPMCVTLIVGKGEKHNSGCATCRTRHRDD